MDNLGTDENAQDFSLARDRSRRNNTKKNNRFSALEKLKASKATGDKYRAEIFEEKNVYEEVDEHEYSKIVRRRQEDDWIVDDGTGEYVEDGREIFEDEERDMDKPKKKKIQQNDSSSSRNVNIRPPDSKPSNIKAMFAANALKPRKTEQKASLADDVLLGNIMQELNQSTTSESLMPTPIRLKKKSYISPFSPNPDSAKPLSRTLDQFMHEQKEIQTPNTTEHSNSPSINSKCGANDSTVSYSGRYRNNHAHSPLVSKAFGADDIGRVKDGTDLMAREKDCADYKLAREDVNMDVASFSNDDTYNDMDDSCIADAMDWSDDEMVPKTKLEITTDWHDSNQKSLAPINQINQITTNTTTVKPSIATNNKSQNDATLNNNNDKNMENLIDKHGNMPCDQTAEKPSMDTTTNSPMDTPSNAKSTYNSTLDCSQISLTQNAEGKDVFRMYWLDCVEDQFNHPGVVYLFGKTWNNQANKFVSVCIVCKNIQRRIYVLPRPKKVNLKTGIESDIPVLFLDVYEEFDNSVAVPRNILKFKSRKIKKSYAFGIEDIPTESDYLEIRYSADLPIISSDLKGTTFSHIFGTNSSILEIFLLDRKLKGPCWIDISTPNIIAPTSSWCKVELIVEDMETISVSEIQQPPPPLVLVSLAFQTEHAKGTSGNVIAISMYLNTNYRIDKTSQSKTDQHLDFSFITKPKNTNFPYDFKAMTIKKFPKKTVEVLNSERELLALLITNFTIHDPDIIIGHDFSAIGLELTLIKLSFYKIGNWSRLGRLRKTICPKGPNKTPAFFCGRMLCDVMTSSKELIRCRSYDLTELVSHVLKLKREAIEFENIQEVFGNASELLQLMDILRKDAVFIMLILYELNILPLSLQLTNICGNTLAKTLHGGRSERNEYLLLHAFTEKDYIVPDKTYIKKMIHQDLLEDESEIQNNQKKTKRKPAYLGGLVLEPKKGFYDSFILLLDFNSLYPSIIQEYNICFTTINIHEQEEMNMLHSTSIDKTAGILPTEIRKLVQSRKQVKSLMKTSDVTQDQLAQYEIRQKALKLTANSVYGCLGFVNSRFYAQKLASLITAKGREILLKTKDLVQTMNLEVIYGDTDSIMVNTGLVNIEDVYKMGNKIKSEVNKHYRLLEIEIDGVFKSLLLLKKKKYAAICVQQTADGKYVETQELKGLDIVRRDWCELAKEAGQFAVSEILSGKLREQIIDSIHEKLTEVGKKVHEGLIPKELYYISKQLAKAPEEYADKNGQPHVLVAMRLNSTKQYNFKAGDTVYYIICLDQSNLPAMQRAYHPDELARNTNLSIDTKYYLTQQVHPVISRLCDPIEGTNDVYIAECLGLDTAAYKQSIKRRAQEAENMLGSLITETMKYKNCEKFVYNCEECSYTKVVSSLLESCEGGKNQFSLAQCSNLSCTVVPTSKINSLKNQLSMVIQNEIDKYYDSFFQCEDIACNYRTQMVPLHIVKNNPTCPACLRSSLYPEYTEKMLYTQLEFYSSIFDVERGQQSYEDIVTRENVMRTTDPSVIEAYQSLKEVVDSFLKRNRFSAINLSNIFSKKK